MINLIGTGIDGCIACKFITHSQNFFLLLCNIQKSIWLAVELIDGVRMPCCNLAVSNIYVGQGSATRYLNEDRDDEDAIKVLICTLFQDHQNLWVVYVFHSLFLLGLLVKYLYKSLIIRVFWVSKFSFQKESAKRANSWIGRDKNFINFGQFGLILIGDIWSFWLKLCHLIRWNRAY